MIKSILLITICLINLFICKQIILYDPINDDIELLDVTNYEKTVFNSSKATIIEFFAHWCGTCQRFAPRKQKKTKNLFTNTKTF